MGCVDDIVVVVIVVMLVMIVGWIELVADDCYTPVSSILASWAQLVVVSAHGLAVLGVMYTHL